MAGIRALSDYRKANRTAREVAALFSAGREDSPALIARLVEESKKLRRRNGELEEVACRVEAEELLRISSSHVRTGSGSDRVSGSIMNDGSSQNSSSEARVITKVFDDRSADSLKHLALALIAHPNVVALLGSRDSDTARLVFARSTDAPGDMNTLMHRACSIIGGRGGGKPDMAQGGGKDVEKLGEALDQAAKSLS
jgi:alanyl-tRNA synthetase